MFFDPGDRWSNDDDLTSLLYLIPGFYFAYTNYSIPGMYYLVDPIQSKHKWLVVLTFWTILPWLAVYGLLQAILAVPSLLFVTLNQLSILSLGWSGGTDRRCFYLSILLKSCPKREFSY